MIRAEARRLPVDIAWGRLLPSWPLLLGLAVFCRLVAARLDLLHDPDTYLHIAAGHWMLAHGALPTHDPFSFSMPGATWISAEWLAQIILAEVYGAIGWGGLIVLTAACAALALGLLLHFLLRRLEPLPALIAAIAAGALLAEHVLARPHLLALPLLVLWTGLLLGARDDGKAPPFAALPVMLLWANLHGSFLFGLALAAFLAGEAVCFPGIGRSRCAEARRWGSFALAAVVAALVTPHGLAGLIQPLRLMQMPALHASFSEWLSPNFQTNLGLDAWMVGLLFIGFATGVRVPLTRAVLLAGLVHMTLQHVRHADILAIAGPLGIAAPLARQLAALAAGAPPSRLIGWAARLARPPGLAATALTLAVGAAFAAPTLVSPVARPDDMATPGAALAEAQRLGLSGPVFNSEGFGGYLIFRGVPTLIDGRIEMYGDTFLARHVKAQRGDAAALQEILQRYHITWALLMPDDGAAAALRRMPGWQQVYADQYAVVERRIAPNQR